MTPDRISLANQLRVLHASDLYVPLQQAARDAGLPLPFVLAIASRETNCLNELGDFRLGHHHGVGIMQVDIQHEPARLARDDGTWLTHPERLMHFACGLLRGLWDGVAAYPQSLAVEQQLKLTAAAYNCGLASALAGHVEGDCDRRTTGHDYGRDVIARMAVFESLTAERPA